MLVVTMGELAAKLPAENGYYRVIELNGNFPTGTNGSLLRVTG
jgi:hypothetical protein